MAPLGHSRTTLGPAGGWGLDGGLGGKGFARRFAGSSDYCACHFDVDWLISVDDVDVMMRVVEGRYCIVCSYCVPMMTGVRSAFTIRFCAGTRSIVDSDRK